LGEKKAAPTGAGEISMTTLKIPRTIDRSVAVRVSVIVPIVVLMMASVVRAEDVVTHWNKVMLDTIAAEGTDPITSTRAAAIVQAAVFDSVNGIQRKYTPIHADIAKPDGALVSAAVIESAYTTLLALYPHQRHALRTERKASLAKLHASPDAIKTGQEYGALVAVDILTWRSTDGFDQELPPFLGGDDIGQWRPTPPDFRPGALPQVATMVPWSITSPSQFRPAGPPSLTSDKYTEVFNEVKTMGIAGDSPRTPDQTLLAIFWAGNTPAYWNRIAISVIDKHPRLTLIQKARVFALMNITMSDAAIATWDAKYQYVFWRPITAITLADLDGNPATDVDPTWTPLLGGTPAHPEYISGHSTISASAAAVLAHVFGDTTAFLIDSERVPGVWRAFPSFSAAVLEIHDARVFGGIHFRTACLDGSVVGTAVAHYVIRHSMRPI
jgi:membrane-associated phospholipid phosphatase